MTKEAGLTDVDLVQFGTKEFNRLLKERNVDKETQKKIKARRRTLKIRYIYVRKTLAYLLLLIQKRRFVKIKWTRLGVIRKMGRRIPNLVPYLPGVKGTASNT